MPVSDNHISFIELKISKSLNVKNIGNNLIKYFLMYALTHLDFQTIPTETLTN
jgi:hypothetical protein